MKTAILKNLAIFTEKQRSTTLLKGDSNTGVFCEYCEIFKKTYSEERLLTAASDFFKTATEHR